MKNSRLSLVIRGLNLTQFFSRIKRQNITLYKLEKLDYKTLSFEISQKDYYAIENYLNKFFKVLSKRTVGQQRALDILKANLGFLVGFVIVLMMTIYSTTIVWRVEVFGIQQTSKTDVVAFLAEQNVKVGKIFNADTDILERNMMQSIPTIADVSIQKRGTSILVNISEKLEFAQNEFEPIKATFNGIVKNIKLYSGFATVKINDFVRIGDVLVQPFLTDNQGNIVKVKPVADILLEAQVTGSAMQAIDERLITYTGKTASYTYFTLGNIKLLDDNFCKKFEFYDKLVYTEYVSKFMVLPIKRHLVTYREIIIESRHNTLECCIDKLKSESEKNALSKLDLPLKDYKSDVVISEIAGYYVCTTNILIEITIN